MNRPKTVYLFTNRNCMVFNEEGKQMAEYQGAIDCYKLNKKKAFELSDKALKFHISKFEVWDHEISRREFQFLLGLRTREMDNKEIEEEIKNELI